MRELTVFRQHVREGALLVLIIICFLLLTPFCLNAQEDRTATEKAPDLLRSKILTITHPNQSEKTQILELIIMEGNHQNEKIKVNYYPYSNIYLNPGEEVFVRLEMDKQEKIQAAYVVEIARDKTLIYLFLGFMGFLALIGGRKGIKAIVSLALTYLAIFKVLLPLIIQGYDPIIVTVVISIGLTVVTLTIVSGINRKTLAAIIGTAGGLAAAAILSIYMGNMAKLTGAGNEDSYLFQYISQDVSLKGLLFAGMIMGALGAVMDVGMSIASAINEIQEKTYHVKTLELIKAGMNVGRDVMGTMANTLILAYAGGSMNILLLNVAENNNLFTFVNNEYIAAEIIRALAGSIGLILTVPLTAVVAGLISRKSSF